MHFFVTCQTNCGHEVPYPLKPHKEKTKCFLKDILLSFAVLDISGAVSLQMYFYLIQLWIASPFLLCIQVWDISVQHIKTIKIKHSYYVVFLKIESFFAYI